VGGLLFLLLVRWDLAVVLFRLGRGSCCGLLLYRVSQTPRSGLPVCLHCLRRVTKSENASDTLYHTLPLPHTTSLNPNPMPFLTDPIPGWSGLLDGPLLGPAPTECVSGCQLLVRATGLNPLRPQDKSFREAFTVAVLGAVNGRQHVTHRSLLPRRNPATIELLLCFKEEAESTRHMQSIAAQGEIIVPMPTDDPLRCLAMLRPAPMRSDEVTVIIRGVPQGYGRVGLASHILTCAGYATDIVSVVREFAGAVPAQEAILFPTVACGDVAVAVVRPPEGDRSLSCLPRRIVSYALGIEMHIQVQGHGLDRPRPVPCRAAPAAPPLNSGGPATTPPNPFRQQQRERSRHFRAANRAAATSLSRGVLAPSAWGELPLRRVLPAAHAPEPPCPAPPPLPLGPPGTGRTLSPFPSRPLSYTHPTPSRTPRPVGVRCWIWRGGTKHRRSLSGWRARRPSRDCTGGTTGHPFFSPWPCVL
jgi:hypothetical protein